MVKPATRRDVVRHLQGAYAGMELRPGAFPIAERLADQILSLPIGPHLSHAQAAQTIEALLEY